MTAVGDARKRHAVENTRRVRVTVEGEATTWPGSSVVRVYVGASQVVTVDPSWHGVSVEDVQPERVWTDGDVLLSDYGSDPADNVVRIRRGGVWVAQGNGNIADLDDERVAERLCQNTLAPRDSLLRYQAGE